MFSSVVRSYYHLSRMLAPRPVREPCLRRNDEDCLGLLAIPGRVTLSSALQCPDPDLIMYLA